jgi:hypothetical protein
LRGIRRLVLPLIGMGFYLKTLFSKELSQYTSVNVSEVGSIFKTNDFEVAFASNLTKSQAVSMNTFKNTGAFQDQENVNLFNFTNYDSYPDDVNSTLKSFSKNLLVESEKVGDPRNGAVFM